jgi:hypothetical protein
MSPTGQLNPHLAPVHVQLRLHPGGVRARLACRPVRVQVCSAGAGAAGGEVSQVPRHRARAQAHPAEPGRSIAVDCRTDGHRHQVPADVASHDLARDGRVRAVCGHLVIAAALADLPRPPCPLCYPAPDHT